jgi:putative nucleotidyltransferase with HDIG domain
VAEVLMVLGYRGLRSLVLAVHTAELLARDYGVYGCADRGLWLHALATATAARVIAREAQLGNRTAEELFVAGLLHDVGKALVATHLQGSIVGPLPVGADIIDFEQDVIGIDHAEAGGLVCATWNLGDEIRSIVEHHHSTHQPDGLAKLTAAVRLADAYAHEVAIGFDPTRVPTPRYVDRDLAAVGFDESMWSEVRGRVESAVDAALAHLGPLTQPCSETA